MRIYICYDRKYDRCLEISAEKIMNKKENTLARTDVLGYFEGEETFYFYNRYNGVDLQSDLLSEEITGEPAPEGVRFKGTYPEFIQFRHGNELWNKFATIIIN